jgi:hypothetical protein
MKNLFNYNLYYFKKFISNHFEKGIDVKELKPTIPTNEDEIIKRYKEGRIAEMTEHQAGL